MDETWDAGVELEKDENRWERLPSELRSDLVTGTERLRTIREDLKRVSLVSSLPPIRVIDQIWVCDRGFVNGAIVCLRWRGLVWYAAGIPAQTALYEDEGTVRGIVVHEFAHCFDAIRRVLTHAVDGGLHVDPFPHGSGPFEDEEHHHELLGEPGLWFPEAEVANLVDWHDMRMQPIAALVKERQLHRYFPVATPIGATVLAGEQLSIPPDVADHIHGLRGRR